MNGETGAAGAAGLLPIILAALVIAGMWKAFAKAGKPGWAAIIPIYNIVVLLDIVGRPLWWIILLLIPFVNFVVGILLNIDFAKAFGKGIGFAIFALSLFPFIGFPLLGFGSATYSGR